MTSGPLGIIDHYTKTAIVSNNIPHTCFAIHYLSTSCRTRSLVSNCSLTCLNVLVIIAIIISIHQDTESTTNTTTTTANDKRG
jgi:hypothetical protein